MSLELNKIYSLLSELLGTNPRSDEAVAENLKESSLQGALSSSSHHQKSVDVDLEEARQVVPMEPRMEFIPPHLAVTSFFSSVDWEGIRPEPQRVSSVGSGVSKSPTSAGMLHSSQVAMQMNGVSVNDFFSAVKWEGSDVLHPVVPSFAITKSDAPQAEKQEPVEHATAASVFSEFQF